MLQLIFTKTVRATGESWVHELPEPDAAFMDEYAALTPRMAYGVDMGWKQSLSDAFAGATTKAEFISSLDKKYTAFVNGTIRAAGGGGVVVRLTPLEAEIQRLAMVAITEAIAGTANEKMDAAKKKAYAELYAETHDAELREKAKLNIAGTQKVRAVSKEDLAALFAVKTPESLPPKKSAK